MHLTLMPYIPSAGELKTKPTQHSVKELRSIGIQPDILLCRSDREISVGERKKIALFCNVRPKPSFRPWTSLRFTTCRSPTTARVSIAKSWPLSASRVRRSRI